MTLRHTHFRPLLIAIVVSFGIFFFALSAHGKSISSCVSYSDHAVSDGWAAICRGEKLFYKTGNTPLYVRGYTTKKLVLYSVKSTLDGTVNLGKMIVVKKGETVSISTFGQKEAYDITYRGMRSGGYAWVKFAPSITVEPTYTITNSVMEYLGNTYEDSAAVGAPALSSLIFIANACNADAISTDGTDITDLLVDSSSVHLALVNIFGLHVTMLVPDAVVSSAAEVESLCSVFGLSVDLFVPNMFVKSGDDYVFVTIGDATVASGYTNPPAITTL